jgi:hypothetical protein
MRPGSPGRFFSFLFACQPKDSLPTADKTFDKGEMYLAS